MTPLDQVNLSELPSKNTRLEQTRLLLQEALTSSKRHGYLLMIRIMM